MHLVLRMHSFQPRTTSALELHVLIGDDFFYLFCIKGHVPFFSRVPCILHFSTMNTNYLLLLLLGVWALCVRSEDNSTACLASTQVSQYSLLYTCGWYYMAAVAIASVLLVIHDLIYGTSTFFGFRRRYVYSG